MMDAGCARGRATHLPTRDDHPDRAFSPSRALPRRPHFRLQDRILGALVVADTTGRVYDGARRPGSRRRFAAQATIALDNAGLYRDLQTRLRRSRARPSPNSRRQQKMEAIGHLAGGIAHEFNKSAHGDSRTRCAPSRSVCIRPSRPFRSRVDPEGVRACRDVDAPNSSRFSRRQVLQPTLVNVNRIVTDMLPDVAVPARRARRGRGRPRGHPPCG